jgi:HEAT repeat protein
MSFLDQAKGDDKAKVVTALGDVGAEDKKLTGQMTSLALKSTDPAVRQAALKALPKMADAQGQVNTILGALNDPSAQNRVNAIGALGTLGRGNAEAARALEAMASDPSAEVRAAAKKALEQMKAKQ